ncbi:MAG: VanZ family protein [Patescibacteria group bacterium]
MLSAVPDLKSGLASPIDFVLRKIAHITEYGILAWFFIRLGYSERKPGQNRIILLISWLAVTLYAVTDELHQSLVLGRQGTVIDVLIDSAGGLAAVLIWQLIKKTKIS